MSEPERMEDAKKARPLNQHDQSSCMNPQELKHHEQPLQWFSQGPQCIYCGFQFNFMEFLSMRKSVSFLYPLLGSVSSVDLPCSTLMG